MSAADRNEKSAEPRRANRRGAARLAAVQALYQMDVGGTSLEDTLAQFQARFQRPDNEDGEFVEPDSDYFGQIVRGVLKHQTEIDPLVNRTLDSDWPVSRIDATLRAVLRAGAFELLRKHDVPGRVTINEYVDVANAFFEGSEAGMVNGVLDRIAANRPEKD